MVENTHEQEGRVSDSSRRGNDLTAAAMYELRRNARVQYLELDVAYGYRIFRHSFLLKKQSTFVLNNQIYLYE